MRGERLLNDVFLELTQNYWNARSFPWRWWNKKSDTNNLFSLL